MSTDLTLSNARADRDGLVDRTHVLDKVGVLRMLPDDMHVTTDMIAEFYEVPVETIRSIVGRNREEFDSDGVQVMSRAEFDESFKLQRSSRASSFMLYPRRAVLRTGMLLRDSEVARRVRDMLLDVEGSQQEAEDALIHRALTVSARRIAELTQFKRAIEGGAGLSPRDFHKKYFSTVTEREFFDHLYAKGLLINQRERGGLRTSGPRAGTYRDGPQHRKPSYKGKPYFYLHTDRDKGGIRRENTHVLPGEPELALRDLLVSQGLKANENTGSAYALTTGEDE
jgi:hypothetical protein